MLPWYIKHTNCASTVGEREGGGGNLKKVFDLNIKRFSLEDMVTNCTSVWQASHKKTNVQKCVSRTYSRVS